jgi:hypothetical protein
MKKINIAACLLLTLVAAAYYFLGSSLPSAEAQSRGNNRESRSVAEPGNDVAMAAQIRRFTSRSSARAVSGKRREASLDLNGGFQYVALARMGDSEHIEGYCATSIEEANAFFGRDLETGDAVPGLARPKHDLTKVAADHGMSLEDFVLYSRMAAEFATLQAAPQSSTINIVNNDGAGEGFNDPTPAFAIGEGGNNGLTRGEQRLNVFTAAAAVWGGFLDSSVPIQVRSQMDAQECSQAGAVLGSAGTTTVHSGFAGAPFPGTWYNQALANKLSGVDRSSAQPDINATFNINIDNGCLQAGSRWYYGLDNATPAGRINLFIVLLHEMGHGLGFQEFANNNAEGTNTGILFNGAPDQWSRMMYDAATNSHWDVMTDAQRQASAVSNGGLRWDGANAMIAATFLTQGRDESGRIRLYAPTGFDPGSSVSHFDTFCAPNLLMEPFINQGLPLDLDLTRQVMRDIGWYRDTTADRIPDTITNVLPASGTIAVGSTQNIGWTNTGGFNRNVTIELSTDGGATYPTTIAANIPNSGSYQWTVPNIPGPSTRVRVREANFVAPMGASSGNFSITAAVSSISISGKVLSTAGRVVARGFVSITGPGVSRSVPIDGRGGYLITGLIPGVTYSITASSGRFTFTPRTITPGSNVTGFNLSALN